MQFDFIRHLKAVLGRLTHLHADKSHALNIPSGRTGDFDGSRAFSAQDYELYYRGFSSAPWY